MLSVSLLALLLPLVGVSHAAMEPPMNNLTVDFLTSGTGTDASTLAVRAGTSSLLGGTYALLVFDSERCASDALCVMSTNLTSASATTLLGLRTVHELLASGSQSQSSSNGILQLPEDIDSADGTMRLLFNTTDNAAPANAADLLSAPWSNDRVVAGSEDTKPRKCNSRSRRARRRCRSLSGLGNGTLDVLDGNSENEAGRPIMRTAFGWAVAGFVMLVVA